MLRDGQPMSYHETHGGYWRVSFDFDENHYTPGVSRLVWECVNGRVLTKNEIIDHGPGGRKDNRMINLILSDHVHNARNRRMLDSNTSGINGVGYHNGKRRRKRWFAKIHDNNRKQKFKIIPHF